MNRLGKKHAAFFKLLPPGWKEIFRTELPEPCYRFSSSHFTSWERSWLIRRSVCSLAFTIADIGTVIACTKTTFFCDSFTNFFHKDVQVSASRMAVTIGAFNHNLDFSKI